MLQHLSADSGIKATLSKRQTNKITNDIKTTVVPLSVADSHVSTNVMGVSKFRLISPLTSTSIQYHLPRGDHVEVGIYNTQGQLVALLQGGGQEAGTHQFTWKADEFASGTYFYRITAGADQEVRKMLLLR